MLNYGPPCVELGPPCVELWIFKVILIVGDWFQFGHLSVSSLLQQFYTERLPYVGHCGFCG